MKSSLVLLTRKDVQEVTNWSPRKVDEVFNSKDFPILDIGKDTQVEEEAFRRWMSVPRRI